MVESVDELPTESLLALASQAFSPRHSDGSVVAPPETFRSGSLLGHATHRLDETLPVWDETLPVPESQNNVKWKRKIKTKHRANKKKPEAQGDAVPEESAASEGAKGKVRKADWFPERRLASDCELELVKQDKNDALQKASLHTLKAAMQDQDVQLVKEVLAARADPNGRIKHQVGCMTAIGTPLTFAVQLGNEVLVRELISWNAHPDSQYSMTVGVEEVLMHSPAAGVAIASKQFSMLKLLVESRANLQGRLMTFSPSPGRSSTVSAMEPNGTLLYLACYVGCLPIVRYLVQHCTPDHFAMEVKYQDDLQLMMTPLHVAAWLGHCDVVQHLLKHGAEIPPSDDNQMSIFYGKGPPPLASAVESGHVGMVRLLVKASASIFDGNPPMGREKGTRGVDHIFRTNNQVIVAAVAKSLGSISQDAVCKMKTRDLVTFLHTPNSSEIIDAIFRPRKLQDWKGQSRVQYHTGQILGNSVRINVASGPDSKVLDDLFLKRKAEARTKEGSIYDDQAQPGVKSFMEKLLPNRLSDQKSERQVPIEVCQSLLPGIHEDVAVMWALAVGPNLTVFDHAGAQALVTYGWRKVKWRYLRSLLINLLLALNFLLMAVMIKGEISIDYRYPVCAVAWCLWAWAVCNEVLQLVGMYLLGHLRSYLWDVRNLLDVSRLVLTGLAIALVHFANDLEICRDFWPRALLSLVMFLRWNRVLYGARGFEVAGQFMLPIMKACASCWPFLAILICPCVGFVNAYYMLGTYDFFTCMTTIYRMGFVGDFDLEEAENIDPTFVPNEDGILEVEDPVKTDYHVHMTLLMILVTLAFTIVLMNVFIGVLGESYTQHYAARQRIFLHARANIVFEIYAVDKASETIFRTSCLWSQSHAAQADQPKELRSQRLSQRHEERHLWYCRPKHDHEFGAAEKEDEEDTDKINMQQLIAGAVKDELSQLRAFMEKIDRSIKEMKVSESRNERPQMPGLAQSLQGDWLFDA